MDASEGPKKKQRVGRIIPLLIIGIPAVVFTYFQVVGTEELGLPEIPEMPEISAEGIRTFTAELFSAGEKQAADEEDPDAEFMPGSMVNALKINKNVKLKGQEMSLEEQRELARKSFRDGRILSAEEAEEE